MGRYLPAETQLTELPMPTQDVVLQLFSHRSVEVPIGVPAVVEPLLVLVLAGAAQVEERTPGGQWSTVNVRAGNFFLTDTDEPYEMRWQALEGERFEVMHLYLGLPLIDRRRVNCWGRRAPALPCWTFPVHGTRRCAG